MPYVLGYIAGYGETYALPNFAGNLVSLKDEYRRSIGPEKEQCVSRFHTIMDALVLPNGVRKTTFAFRQTHILEKVLADEQCRPQSSAIRVLDLPSSIGIASLHSLEMLQAQYAVTAYVLGDQSFRVYYDRQRECIFDEEHNLLQVKLHKHFFSIYRGHRTGDDYRLLTKALMLPVDLVSRYLKRKYVYEETREMTPILLVHPDVEAELGIGVLSVKRMDVFEPIEGEYDLVLSFNLLQRNYFAPSQIAKGLENLKHALSDQGVLVMGSPDTGGLGAFSVARKNRGTLEIVRREGEF